MLEDEIRAGESSYIEFKVELPKRNEKYINEVFKDFEVNSNNKSKNIV